MHVGVHIRYSKCDSLLALRISRRLKRIFFMQGSTEDWNAGGEKSKPWTPEDSIRLLEAYGGDTGTIKNGVIAPHRFMVDGATPLAIARAASGELSIEGPQRSFIESSPEKITPYLGRESVYTRTRIDISGHNSMLSQYFWKAVRAGESTLVEAFLDMGVPTCGRWSAKQTDNNCKNGAEGEGCNSNPSKRLHVGTSTTLHVAAALGHADVVDVLVKADSMRCASDRNIKTGKSGQFSLLARATDANGRMAMHLAAGCSSGPKSSDGNIEVLKILLDWGCPLAAKDHNKQTILHHAARSGNTGVLKYVLQRWITAASSNGTCHVAASSNPKVYDLRRGGLLDWRDRWSRTSVHWCVLNQHIECLKILLAAGASAMPPKPHGSRSTRLRLETPLEIARRLEREQGIDRQRSSLKPPNCSLSEGVSYDEAARATEETDCNEGPFVSLLLKASQEAGGEAASKQKRSASMLV